MLKGSGFSDVGLFYAGLSIKYRMVSVHVWRNLQRSDLSEMIRCTKHTAMYEFPFFADRTNKYGMNISTSNVGTRRRVHESEFV